MCIHRVVFERAKRLYSKSKNDEDVDSHIHNQASLTPPSKENQKHEQPNEIIEQCR